MPKKSTRGELGRNPQSAKHDLASEHKRTGKEPHQSEELFRTIVESVKDYAVFMLDPQGKVASWNLGAEQIKGYKPQEIIGQHFAVFYAPEEIKSGKPMKQLDVALRQDHIEEEGWRIRKDSSWACKWRRSEDCLTTRRFCFLRRFENCCLMWLSMRGLPRRQSA
jgi:PAS domain S-box-containing protein